MALEFNDMPKQQQWGVIGGLCAVILGLFYWYYWAPTAVTTTAKQGQISQMQMDNQRTMLIAGQLAQLEVEVDTMESQLATLANILPEEQETDVLLRRLEAAAVDTNLVLRRSTYEAAVLHDFYAEMPIELDLVGSFHDLAMFFDRVSKFGRIVTVGQVTISAVSDGSPNTIQAQCTASTFYFLPEAEVPEDAAASTGG